MKKLFVVVPAIPLALLLMNSCAQKEKKSAEQTTSADSVRTAAADRNNPTQANVVLKSIDGGKTWQNISEGVPEPVKDEYGVSRNVFFTDDNGLWLSAGNEIYHNNPNSTAPLWTKETFPSEHGSIAPGTAGIYAYHYGGGGIFHKTKGTAVWSPVFTNFREKRIFSIFETSGGTIFIGSERGLFKSTNSGKSWKQLPIGGGGKIVESNGVLLATSEAGILRSADDGESWSIVISEGGVGIDVERIEGGFAAINYSRAANTRRIQTSYDGGKTWQPIDEGFPGQASMDSSWRPITVGNKVSVIADSNWHTKEAPIQAEEYKTSVIQVGKNFFCGHTYGIYRSSYKGHTWALVHCAEEGKMFRLYVSGKVIYAIQVESHC